MPIYLGIDYGLRHIGLAISDPAGKLAFPLKLLTVSSSPAKAAEQVLREIEGRQIDAIVIGLPINMNGAEGPQAGQTRRFAGELARRTEKPIHLHDERLSSFAAEQLLSGPPEKPGRKAQRPPISPKKSRRRVDPIAAQLILQGFIDRHRSD